MMGIFFVKYFWVMSMLILLTPVLIGSGIRQKLDLTSTDLLVILFLLYILLQSLFLGIDFSENKKLAYFLLSGLVYFSIRQVLSGRMDNEKTTVLSLLLITIFLTTITSIIYGILQKVDLIEPLNPDFPVTGTFFQPAAFAGFIAGVFPLACYSGYRLVHQKTKGPLAALLKGSAIAAACLIILILPSLSSRAATAGAVAGTIFILLSIKGIPAFFRDRLYKKTGRLVLYMVMVAGTILAVLIAGYRIREGSVNGRMLVWKISSKMVLQHPVFGVGLDAYRYDYPAHQIAYFQSEGASKEDRSLSCEVNAAFNEPLQISYELGILGLILFISILVTVFWGTGNQMTRPGSQQGVMIGAKGALLSLTIFSFCSYPFSLPELTIIFFAYLALANDRPGRYSIMPALYSLFLIVLGAAVLYQAGHAYDRWVAVRKWDRNISEADPKVACEVYKQLFPVLRDNDMFLSTYAHDLFKLGRYAESAALLSLKRGKSYNDLLLQGEDLHRSSQDEAAVDYFNEAFFLLPHRFLPLYHLLLIYEKKADLPAAKAVAQEISDMPVKVESYDVFVIRKKAEDILRNNP